MNWEEFTALLVLATAMSFSPGPNTTLSTALAANHGLKRSMRFVCAVPLGWGLLLTACVFGVGGLLLAVPLLAAVIKSVGIGYLLLLAFKLFNRGQPSIPSSVDIGQPNIGFMQAMAMQFLNIKAWMLALAIVSGWIAGHANPWERFAVVLPLMLAFAFASNLAYAFVGALLKDWLAGPNESGQRLVWFNRTMALVLMLTASWMMTV